VTQASRDATFGSLSVSKGDHIGLVNGELKVTAATPEDCLVKLLESLGGDHDTDHDTGRDTSYEIGTLFYGPTTDKEQAEALIERLSETFSDLELELHAGGPELYSYVMALE
jgi:dihydroxyacetone kinase-like predicted kinase